MNLSFKNVKKKLNKENIERELKEKGYNDYDLARYYIPGFKRFNDHFKSNIRTDDHNNSMICRIQNGRLIISDFGYKTGMNIYNYLIEKYSYHFKDGFYHVLDMIREDFKLDNILPLNKSKSPNKGVPVAYNEEIKESSLPVKIEVKRRRVNGEIHWRQKDIDYWNSYGISIAKLEEKGIAPLEKFWITNFNKDGIRREYAVGEDLCYVYPFYRNKDGYFMYKIYLPKGFKGNKDFKWISNVNKKVIQNLSHIAETGELLVIQSSFKDTMLMEELMKGLNVIAFNGEGMWCDDETWLGLWKRFTYIVLFANNDYPKNPNPGLEFARKHSILYNIPFVCTPDCTTSDISDYYKKYGKEETIKFLNNTFNNINLILYG